MSGSEIFGYVLGNGSSSDILDVTVSTPAATTSNGPGYAVTAITGSIGNTAIGGEIPGTSAFIYPSTSSGFQGSVDGIDSDGLEFTAGSQNFEVYTNQGEFYLYNITLNTKVQLTLEFTDAPCYCPGTLIMTATGERPVEALAIGDVVVTASGQQRPIKWLGSRSYADRFLAANPDVQPIRFCAGSLGDGLPRRDLMVSPEHAMVLDGVLVPARCLVNGVTIKRARGLGRVDYHHVELDSHDVLLAEGAPSESFLDDGSRGVFHNAAGHTALYPDAPAVGQRCAPLVESGVGLEMIRNRLASLIGEVALAA